jgi:serine/threonine-protein kinase
MAVGHDDQIDPRFATLSEAGIVELCGSLSDYGEAGGLSRDLMLQVGRFSETRYGHDLEVLLAVSRMYVIGGETTRAKAALVRAGKLWPDEARVPPLLAHTLKLLDDPRSVDQVLREAPAMPPLHATPPPMPAVRPAAISSTPFVAKRVQPPLRATPPGLPMVKLPPEARKTTPRRRDPAAIATSPVRPRSTYPEADVSSATPASGTPVVPRAPGLPRGVEGAMNGSRHAREPASARGAAVALRHQEEAEDGAEAPRPKEAVPESAPRAVGGVRRNTRIRLLDPEDERRHLDPYELIGEIASGGMATVFLGRLAGAGGFQRFVAIKRLHPHLAREQEFVEMFLDEARIAAGIHNPHVVPILEVGTSDTGYFLVMEFVEGDTLSGLTVRSLQRGASLPPAVALRIVVDALTGLHAAHQLHDADGRPLGLVHRDCTPQNILVGVDGSARITDFGVARAASRITFTRPQQVKGKVGYLSPEQAHAQEIDRRSDIFTMGIVLWEALAGRPLFTADTEAVTLSRLLSAPIPSVRSFAPDLPASLDAVCHRALSRDATRRFRTAAEMVEAIERAANEEGSVGIASPRELGRFVEGVMGAEIAAQRESVRAWLGQSADAAPLSRGPRSTVGMLANASHGGPHSPRGTGPQTPRSGIHSAATGLGSEAPPPPDSPAPAAQRAPSLPPVAVKVAPAERPVEKKAAPSLPPVASKQAAPPEAEPEPAAATPAPPAPAGDAPSAELPAAEIDVTLPAGPAAKPRAENPIRALLARVPRVKVPAALSRLLGVKMKTRSGVALVAVLVLLAMAPLALKVIRMRRARGRAAAAAHGPRNGPGRIPTAKPKPTAWDDGEWYPPDGGAAATPDEPPPE